MTDRIVWEFRCPECKSDKEIPDGEVDFQPSSLARPNCDDCGERMVHVGPILDECDKCGQELLYRGNSGLGDDTLCETCYGRLEAFA